MRYRFNKTYFVFATLLFLLEVLIALFVKDRFVRPYLGDVLVVILIYCFIKSFFDFAVTALIIAVLVFAFTIEFLQYLHFIKWLGLEKSTIASIVFGTSFAWNDIIAYTAGALIIAGIESLLPLKKNKATHHDRLT